MGVSGGGLGGAYGEKMSPQDIVIENCTISTKIIAYDWITTAFNRMMSNINSIHQVSLFDSEYYCPDKTPTGWTAMKRVKGNTKYNSDLG